MSKFDARDYIRRKYSGEEEEPGASSSKTSDGGFDARRRIKEKYIGFDTFSDDLNAMSDTINSIYGGWQDAETMSQTKKKVEETHKRLLGYEDYRKTYGDEGYTDLSELVSGYQGVLDDWDSLTKAYGEYESADEFNAAVEAQKKKEEEDAKRKQAMMSANVGGMRSEIAGLEGLLKKAKEYDGKLESAQSHANAVRGRSKERASGNVGTVKQAQRERDIFYAGTGYSSADDIVNEIAKRKSFADEAEVLQGEDKALKAGDFDKYVTIGKAQEYKDLGLKAVGNYVEHLRNNPTAMKGQLSIVPDDRELRGKPELALAAYGTEDEYNIYNYYFGQESEGLIEQGTADRYIESIMPRLEQRWQTEKLTELDELAHGGFWSKIGASALSVGYSLGGAGEHIVDSIDYALTSEYDNRGRVASPGKMDDNFSARASSTIRSRVSQDVDWEIGNWDAFDFVYNTSMSAIDSAVAATLFPGNAGAAILGLSAAGQGVNDALDRGLSGREAFWNGFYSGCFEMAFERMSIGNLKAFKDLPVDGLKTAFKNLGKTMLVNAFEETLTELANIAYDTVHGEMSNYSIRVQELIDSGKTRSEAEIIAKRELRHQVYEAGASGALMGFGFGVVGNASAARNTKSVGSRITANEKVGEVFDLASLSPEESMAYEAYSRYAGKGVTSENATAGQVGVMALELRADAAKVLRDVNSTEAEKEQARKILTDLEAYGQVKSISRLGKGEVKKVYGDAESIEAIIAEGLESGEGTKAFELATEYKAKVDSGKKLSAAEITRLVDATDAAVKSETEKAASERLTELGETGDVEKLADIIARKETGELLTSAEQKMLEESEFGSRVAEEVTASEEELSEASVGLSEEEATLFRENYSGGDVENYRASFDLVSELARNNYGADYILENRGVLSPRQVQSIYSKVVTEPRMASQRALDGLVSKYEGRLTYKSKVDDSIFNGVKGEKLWKSLNKRQKQAITFAKAFAKGAGINLTITYGKKYNGYYDPATNSIVIDARAGFDDTYIGEDAIIPTMSHELTHWAKKKAPELYAELSRKIFGILKDSKGLSEYELISAEKGEHPEFSDDKARDEIIARACEDLFAMSEEGRRIYDSLSESEQKTLTEKIKEIIKNLVDWVNELLGLYESKSDEARILRGYKDGLSEVAKIWDEMFTSAVRVNAALEGEGVFGNLENGISEDGTTIVGEGVLQMSEKTYYDGGRDYLAKWLKRQKGLTQEDKDDILRQTDKVAEIMRAVAEGNELPDYSRWANLEVVKDEKGEKVLSVIVKNGDYTMNIDFLQVCKKRVALNAVLNAMVQAGDLNVHVLTETDVADLNAIIKKHDFEIACALCFVDSKRYRVGAWAESFCEGTDTDDGTHKYGFNEMVRSLVPKGSKIKVDEFNFTKRDIKNQPTKNLLSEASDSELDFSLIDKIMSENDVRSAQHRYARAIKENPQIRKILNSAEIISSIGLDAIRLEAPALYSIINGHQGTAKPKFSHDAVAYGNDVLKARSFTAKRAKMVGGVRCQSFSDFQANMIMDYAQFISELAAKRLTSHSYTKEPLFVKLFGMTGMKINMSLVPKAVDMTPEQQKQFAILKDKNADKNSEEYKAALEEYEKLAENAGLDENGNYIWEDETFPYDIAMEIVDDPRYSANCGTIAVGISKAHILKLLADDKISMVIPYHKSGLNRDVAMMRDIALYHDYTSVQNTRYANDEAMYGDDAGKKLNKDKGDRDFDFYGDLYGVGKKEGTHDPKKTAQNYLDWCDKHNYTPRFDEFRDHPNYYKLLVDFRVYDTDGTYREQQAVKAIYPEEAEFKDLILNGVKDKDGKVYGGLRQQQETSDRLDRETKEIVDEYRSELEGKYGRDVLGRQYSRKDDDTFTRMREIRLEIDEIGKSIKSLEASEEYNALLDKVFSGGAEEVKEFETWLTESGYSELEAKQTALEEELTALKKSFEADAASERAEEERKAIEKSGLEESEYFAKLAVKEFGYTPYFYDAGYIVPNGKMLNFSGEKGKHYGSRGQDHRAIGTIFANARGGEAMVKFMGQGNVRIMAESPGIDISSLVEPTKEQYATIRRFARESAKDGYFFIDFTDSNGHTVGNYEYDGRINPERIVSDIRYYFEHGATKGGTTSDLMQFHTMGDGVQYSEKVTITQADIDRLRSIPKNSNDRVSVNAFTSEDIKKAEPFARRMWEELGVKSPFFRAWFGDWRVNDSSTVSMQIKQGDKRGGAKNTDTGWDIIISRQIHKETSHHGSAIAKSAVKYLPYIKSITENAVLFDSYISNKDNPLSIMYHKLYAYTEEFGYPALLKLTVEELIDEKSGKPIRRDYILHNIEEETISKRNRLSTPNHNETASSAISISDLFQLVKTYDEEFHPKEASKVVNADGTPKIVYHSTDEDFTVFDITKSRSWDGTPDYDLPGFYFSENYDDSAAYGENVGEYYIKITTPYEGDVYSLKKEFGSYRKAYEYLIEQGYDGVIIDELGEGSYEYIVLKPENIKSATDNIGTYDGNNPNKLYSRKNEGVSAHDIMGKQKELEKRYKILEADFARLKEMYRLDKRLTHGKVLDPKQVEAVARYLVKFADSDYKASELAPILNDLYVDLREMVTDNPDATWDMLYSKAYEVAKEIRTKAKVKVERPAYFEKILKDIRSARISPNEGQKGDAKHRFGDHYVGKFRGRVTIANDGTPLDIKWAEWAAKYPDVFDKDIGDAQQLVELYDIYDELRNAADVVVEYEESEMLSSLANEIINKAWMVDTFESMADKQEKRMKELRAEHRKAMEEMRETYEAKVSDAKRLEQMYYGRLLAETRRKRKEDVAEAKRLGRERLAEYRENAERKRVIGVITSDCLKLNKMLVTNSNDLHIHEALKGPVMELLDAIDFSSRRLLEKGVPTKKDISLEAALAKVKDMMAKASAGDFDLVQLYGHNLDADIEAMMESVANIRRSFADNEFVLQQMSLDDLLTLKKIVKTIMSAVNKLNEFHVVQHARGVAHLSQDSVDYLDSLGKGKVFDGAIGKLNKTMVWNNTLPYYAFKRYGEGGVLVYEALMDGWDRFAFNIDEIMRFTQSVYTDKEVEAWDNEVKTFKIAVPATEAQLADPEYKPKFQEVQMTVSHIMSIYCLQKRAQAQKHLLEGGIRIENFKKKNGEIVSQEDGAVITEKDIETIVSSLSARQRAVADKLQEFMNTVCSDWGNEVSMARFGIKQFGEEHYFPLKSDDDNLSLDEAREEGDSFFKLLGASFAKPLIKGANNRIVISGVFDVFAKHTSDMAKYNALALPVLDAFRWYNYKGKVAAGSDGAFISYSLKQSMKRAFGDDGLKYFTQFLKDINGTKTVSRDTIGGGFIKNDKIASVGANLRVIFLQPTSYVRASAVIDNKYLTKALTFKDKARGKAVDLAEKYCGIALWKSLGYYDTNVQQGVTEQIKHKSNWHDKATDLSMKGASMADRLTWGLLWNACELEIRDTRKDLKVGSEEFYKAIGKRLREVIYATQVVDSTMTRSQMMRGGDKLDKLTTSFMSEPTLAYNMVLDAVMDVRLETRRSSFKDAWKKYGAKVARTAYAYTMTNALAALVETAFDAYRDDDDEEKELLDYVKMYFANFAQDMGIIGKIPVLKDLISIIRGYGASYSILAGFEGLFTAVKQWWKIFTSDKGNSATALKNTLKALSSISGLPIYNVYRDAAAGLDKFFGVDIEELLNDLMD